MQAGNRIRDTGSGAGVGLGDHRMHRPSGHAPDHYTIHRESNGEWCKDMRHGGTMAWGHDGAHVDGDKKAASFRKIRRRRLRSVLSKSLLQVGVCAIPGGAASESQSMWRAIDRMKHR
jgi:hypothetical protein